MAGSPVDGEIDDVAIAHLLLSYLVLNCVFAVALVGLMRMLYQVSEDVEWWRHAALSSVQVFHAPSHFPSMSISQLMTTVQVM